MCAPSRNLRAAELDERNIARGQCDFEWSAMMRRAEEDRLLLQRRSRLAVLQYALHDVASLVSFVIAPTCCGGRCTGLVYDSRTNPSCCCGRA